MKIYICAKLRKNQIFAQLFKFLFLGETDSVESRNAETRILSALSAAAASSAALLNLRGFQKRFNARQ